MRRQTSCSRSLAIRVHLVPRQMTMDLMGLTKDDLIDGIDEFAGATTALLEAQDAVTLFI